MSLIRGRLLRWSVKRVMTMRRFLVLRVYRLNDVEEKELLCFLEKHTSGDMCAVHRLNGTGHDNEKWGRVTFMSPETAEKATKLTPSEFKGRSLKIAPSRSENKFLSFPAVKAKVSWPSRRTRGFAFVKCNPADVSAILEDLSNVRIRDNLISCRPSLKSTDSVMLYGLEVDLFEAELYDALSTKTNRKILDVCLPRGVTVENPPLVALEEAFLREVSLFMPVGNSKNECVSVYSFPGEAMDYFMNAEISIDGSLPNRLTGKLCEGVSHGKKIKCSTSFIAVFSALLLFIWSLRTASILYSKPCSFGEVMVHPEATLLIQDN